MLAGTPGKRQPTNDFAGLAVSYVCLNYSTTSPYSNKLPDQPCPDGLRAQIFFPSCWDGVNLDSPDHASHMAYPTEYSYDNGPCPASHPVHMISLFYEVIFSTVDFPFWTPESAWQPFVFSMGDPTGYGFHGDFINGWDVPTLQNATNLCTADTGQIYDCPVFDFFTSDETESCTLAPKIDEQIFGTMDNLPGCNPITWGNGSVTPCQQKLPATIGAAQTYYKNVTGWNYVGCGIDNGVNRTFTADQWWDDSVTVEGCMDYCKSRGHPYAGLEYANQCFCGDSLPASRAPTKGVLGNCFTPCAGDSSEVCGGASRLSIYYNPGTYSPVSNSTKSSKIISCPASNNTNYVAAGQTNFNIQCGTDYAGGDMGMQYVASGNLTACMELCAGSSGCGYVALSGAACYMKQGTSLRTVANGAVMGAAVVAGNGASSAVSTASATATSSTSGASSSATLCPGADGQVVNGYTVHCSSDSSVGAYSNAQASSSYLDCMTACDSASSTNCIGFVYVGGRNGVGGGTCWLKQQMGSFTQAGGANYIAASKPKVVAAASASSAGPTSTSAPTCPGSNSTNYLSSSGSAFAIECGMDRPGGDIGNTQVSSFQQCIETCANTTGCVDVSFSKPNCYMKGSLNNAVYGSPVSGARLLPATAAKFNANFYKGGAVAAAKPKKTSTKKASHTTKKASHSTKKASHSSKKASHAIKAAATRPISTTASPSSTVTVAACPYNNNTIYYEPETGLKFLLQCGIARKHNDLTTFKSKNLSGCISACAANKACVDVIFHKAEGVCYLKKALGKKIFNKIINGAKLLSKRPDAATTEAATSSRITRARLASTSATSTSLALIATPSA